MLRHFLKDQKYQRKVSKIRQICVQTTAGPEIRGRVSQHKRKMRHYQLSTYNESVIWRSANIEAVQQIIFYKV